MASSSAVNNVLAAIPVQASKNTPSRHSSDDEASATFKRALDDARTEQKKSPQDNAATKNTSADKRVKPKADNAAVADTEKAPVTSKKNAETKSLEPAAAKSAPATNGDEEAAEPLVIADQTVALVQPLPEQPIATATAALAQALPAQAVTDSELAVVATSAADSLEPELAPTMATTETAQASTLAASSAAQTLTPKVADLEGGDTKLDAKLSASNGITSTKSTESTLLTDADPTDASVLTPVAGVLQDQKTDASTPALNAMVNGALPADKAANATPNSGAETPAAKVATTATPAAATATAALADADVSIKPTDAPVNSDIKTDKQTLAVNDTMVAVSDDAVANDPKMVFEKMLKNMTAAGTINNGVEGRSPESLERTAGLSPAPSSTAGLESLLRGADSATPAARSFVVQTAVPVPVGQPQWSQAVGEKVLWLAAQNVQSADINLNPLDLGPVQVKISVNQEQTTVNFTSHHAVVREVLDQNLGRLREMFSEQGLNLVNVDVSDKSFQRQQGEGSERQGQGSGNQSDDDETVVATSTIVTPRLVDHYA